MKRKLVCTIIGLALASTLGTAWSAGTPEDKGLNYRLLNKQEYGADYSQPVNLWDVPLTLAVLDEHVHQFSTLIDLPAGWVANCGIWNHHELLIRSIGLADRFGSEIFILFGSEDHYSKPMAQVTEKMLLDSNEPWKRVISTRFPSHKLVSASPGHRLEWQVFPPKAAKEMYKADPTLTGLRRGRLNMFFSLIDPRNSAIIKTIACCDFDLIERRDENGKRTATMRNRHTKLCFVPEGQDPAKVLATALSVTNQSEKVSSAWYQAVTDDLVHRDECSQPMGRPYGINHLALETEKRHISPSSLGLNPLTCQRLSVPYLGSTCWVDSDGEYLLVGGSANPNDYAPLNAVEWFRIK